MRDFWLSCGHHLLDRDDGGGLVVTDEFLKAYFARLELAPPAGACGMERAIHESLLTHPRRSVDPSEIAGIVDPDARENWSVVIAFRDCLLRFPTIEAAYLSMVRAGVTGIPSLFINQMVHVILRNALDKSDDAFVVRAAEVFFRPQRLTIHNGSLIAADEELIASSTGSSISPLISMMGLASSAEIDVLVEQNAANYWQRSDLFDMGLDLTAGRYGVAALGKAIEMFLRHLLAVETNIEPLVDVRNAPLSWYVGLDADGTRIGDMLWERGTIDQTIASRIVALYQLTFPSEDIIVSNMGAEPIYLILAMTPELTVRMKPQNLIVGLPLRRMEPAN
ncbi:MAG TPA: DUF6352 family protein [Xanthobacteraceae bacterium]|nr:DUF6352 family protein [Xanthobacteraceae bacterium]